MEVKWKGQFLLSSLTIFIFFTYLDTVFSRHHIRHYRERFKRQQGANLYLPGSYVTDTNEPDEGPWSEWSPPSACSRTCGGGVSIQNRECSTGTCRGPKFRYISCNTQDCPDLSDFRAQQCSEFDKVPFDGVYYQWVPYTKAPNQCELNCMPVGERFYYRHKQQVTDGTRCNDLSPDVCVQGKCRHVGCDMMLGSPMQEDKCRKCGGDGSTCQTIKGRYDKQDLQVGYNNIILIPRGATNIVVQEVEPSNNYLAIRNTSGHYYLNGNWRIDFPRTKEFAGCAFKYERFPQGFSAPDKISALGPTDEPLIIVLLYQDTNVGVDYEYSVPTMVNPGNDSEIYAWTFDPFNPCSVTCGGGLQYRNVTCVGRQSLNPVDERLCDTNTKPAQVQECNTGPCSAQWVPYPWAKCSAPCGGKGEQVREVTCQQINHGISIIVEEEQCAGQQKPPSTKPCSRGPVCPKWHTGPWKACDHMCGDGFQTRKVKCFTKNGTRVEILNDSDCTDPKPDEKMPCNLRPCEGVDWISSAWSGCESKCGLSNETRKVHCASIKGKIYPDHLCEPELKPESVRQCEVTNSSCDYLFYASQWSECSAKCGQGIKTRTVFCGATDGKSVTRVEDSKCDQTKKYETIRNCTAEKKCAGEWFSGPWKECSKKCGGGARSRKVVCILDNEVVRETECDQKSIMFSQEDCNTHTCGENEEATTPTILSTTLNETSTTETFGTSTDTTESSPMMSSTTETETTTIELSTTETSETETTTIELSTTETSETSTTELTSESSTSTSENASDSTSSSSTDASADMTTTESDESVTVPPKAMDDDYEYVQSDTCDDGEWVDADTLEPLMQSDDPLALLVMEKPISQDTSLEEEELMLGDEPAATTIQTFKLIHLEGSGDDEFEGSGSTTTDLYSSTTDVTGSTTDMSTTTDPTTDVTGSTIDTSITTDNTTDVAGSTATTPFIDNSFKAPAESAFGSEPDDESSSQGTTTSGSDATTESGASSESGATTEPGSTTVEGSTTHVGSSLESEATTESGATIEGGSTTVISPMTDVTGFTTETMESGATTESGMTTESGLTTESGMSTVSGITTESGASTEGGSTLESSTQAGSDVTDESGGTTVSGLSTESGGTTESGLTTESGGTTESDLTTESGGPTESGGTTETGLTTESGTTIESGSTVESITSTGSGATEGSGPTTESESTLSTASDSSTETGETTESPNSTVSSVTSETTTELMVSSTSEGSTDSSSITDRTESTIEFTGTTEEYTGSTTEGGSTIETDTGSTTESSVDYTSTLEYSSTTVSDLWSSTTADTTSVTEIFMPRPRMCKRKKKKNSCHTSKHGCCPDRITPAAGPFDEGCPMPKTCKESKFGCCEDGVSPALDENMGGCPQTHCSETLFGCCPDNKTPAEGNDNEGCPPPAPPCLKSKYGCCDDNTTFAKGPKKKGCEKATTPKPAIDCRTTEFGCCPDNTTPAEGIDFKGCDIFKDNCQESYFRCCLDGVTSAQGPNYKGCEMPCSNSTFGCCPDGKTPSHGQYREGCCLVYEHGCCPDNITPARGPQLEGCGCEYSAFGCCPDNKTLAKGPTKEGCDCKDSEFGCCPDDFTNAKGPQFDGCPCQTFQFGCCPDGVSPAKGAKQLGCDCTYSEFGCCSDEATPAKGPNRSGCDCSTSKFGCCLDGTSEARGENFEGCEEVPINAQESCTLNKERGSCGNYTVKWFFDKEYGGCSRFWYGGCGGNKNRFKSKEDCDTVCVKPEGKDRCKLPKISGPCDGYYVQWYYDSEKKVCDQFVYSGCLGNNNRFETVEECNEICATENAVETCEQPVDEGPCRGYFPRWYFDKDSKNCRQFRYGGCKGNHNNFATEDACRQSCLAQDQKKELCDLPKVEGNCTQQEARWYSDPAENTCKPFYYTGCNGNLNNFASEEACSSECPQTVRKDACHLPSETGNCANYTDRFYYDTKERACRHFYYGGCGGNENNFGSEVECKQRCVADYLEPITMPPTPSYDGPFKTEYCFAPSETGPCRAAMPRYFYDRSDGVCKHFIYGGCQGNRNNFHTMDDCYRNCGNVQDRCGLPPVVGECKGEYPQYYYDPATDTCNKFLYGGCGGNYNRFPDQVSCEQSCRRTPPVVVTTAPPVPVPGPSDAICLEPADPGNCTQNQQAFFYDQNTRTCQPFTYSGCGGNRNRFQTVEQCERLCGQFTGQDVCELEKDPGPCYGNLPKYFYNKQERRCELFVYGGCAGNGNRFSSSEDCESVCLTRFEKPSNETDPAVCVLPVDKGTCDGGFNKRWYFDNSRGECIAFIYSGCGGNFNNFKTFQSCLTTCKDYITQTEPPLPDATGPHPCQTQFEQCETLRCPYGIEAFVDENNCNNCRCLDPCRGVECPERMKCAIDFNRNRTSSSDPNFVSVCRQTNKDGQCPRLEQSDQNCERECYDDADCSLDLKCCSTGCGAVCSIPATREPSPLVTLPVPTESPYYPPQIDPAVYEPEVTGEIGGHITLRCAVKGNPSPRISWSKDGIQIDGTKSRFRIKLDQTLQIITLYTTDSGIYLCTADNNLGNPVQNQIKLDVVAPAMNTSASVYSDEEMNPNVVASFNSPTVLNCFALGYPLPVITWWKENDMIPLKTAQFEVRKDFSLLIHAVQLSNLGVYTCQAYNGLGKAASYAVTVQAKGPYYGKTDPENQKYLKYVINPPNASTLPTPMTPTPFTSPPYVRPTQPEPARKVQRPEIPKDPVEFTSMPERTTSYYVPISVNMTTPEKKFPVGNDLKLTCEFQGYPPPQISWFKDGVPLTSSNRINIEVHPTGYSRLILYKATKADSGIYECEAKNENSRATSSAELTVEGVYIHPSCTDNKFFANCTLIVASNYCNHKYYARFCCRSCTEAGLLPPKGDHLMRGVEKNNSLRNNLV